MVKSFQQNKTADWASPKAVTSPKPMSASCPGCHSFQICEISEYALVTVQKCSSWVTAPSRRGKRSTTKPRNCRKSVCKLSFLRQRPQPFTAALRWSVFEEWMSGRETDRKAIREMVQAVKELYIPWKQWQGTMAQTSATNANKKQWPWCTYCSFISLENLHTNFFVYILYKYIYSNGVLP